MRDLFPTLLLATAFGFCNVTARLISISAPMIALTSHPMPIFCAFVAIAGLCSLGLKPLAG